MRQTFASTIEFTEDVETEWDLFKCVRGQTRSEKETAWWNQEVKEVVHAKKAVFRAWLTNNPFEQF